MDRIGPTAEPAPPQSMTWIGPLVRAARCSKKAVSSLTGWRRTMVAAGLGLLAAAALPPLYVLPLLIPAFSGLVWLMDGSPSPRSSFAAGWWFGFGFSVAGLYWIANALLQEPEKFGWMIPFAIFGLSAGMAVFTASATYLAHRGAVTGLGRVLLLASAWTALEWVRSWAFTGFPWNLLGSVWAVSDNMLQLAAVTGVYGLSLLTVVAAAMPAVLADVSPGPPGGRKGVPVAVSFAVLAGVWAMGAARLSVAEVAMVPDVRLRLVQPNIPQRLKWVPELRQGHLMKLIKMTLDGDDGGRASDGRARLPPTHVIWAETAVPFLLSADRDRLAAIAGVVPPDGLVITGAPRATPQGARPFQVWNSLHAIDRQARVTATYDKFHLVPFGEYIPFGKYLNMAKITSGRVDFSPGPGPRTLRLKGLPPVSPLICYEVIFPGRVLDRQDRPQWLLNLTNDAWYGMSSGPFQHLVAAQLRAVEEGMPLVRVANSGISAVIDPYGRILTSLGLERQGVIDSGLPVALRPTIYSRLGDWMAMFLALLTAVCGILAGRARIPTV